MGCPLSNHFPTLGISQAYTVHLSVIAQCTRLKLAVTSGRLSQVSAPAPTLSSEGQLWILTTAQAQPTCKHLGMSSNCEQAGNVPRSQAGYQVEHRRS
ncbi:hypothetical protein ACRRTK_021405 [Alexandromys fortis]